jgi:hypothetical protein
VAIVVRLEPRRPRADPLDGPLELLRPYLVADHERPAHEDQDAGAEVLQGVLEGEADGERGDPQSGDEVPAAERRDDDRGGEEADGHADSPCDARSVRSLPLRAHLARA